MRASTVTFSKPDGGSRGEQKRKEIRKKKKKKKTENARGFSIRSAKSGREWIGGGEREREGSG